MRFSSSENSNFSPREICSLAQEILLVFAQNVFSQYQHFLSSKKGVVCFCCFCKNTFCSHIIFLFRALFGNFFFISESILVHPWGRIRLNQTAESKKYLRKHSEESVIFPNDKSIFCRTTVSQCRKSYYEKQKILHLQLGYTYSQTSLFSWQQDHLVFCYQF